MRRGCTGEGVGGGRSGEGARGGGQRPGAAADSGAGRPGRALRVGAAAHRKAGEGAARGGADAEEGHECRGGRCAWGRRRAGRSGRTLCVGLRTPGRALRVWAAARRTRRKAGEGAARGGGDGWGLRTGDCRGGEASCHGAGPHTPGRRARATGDCRVGCNTPKSHSE
jgi:hypothetical protein